MSQPLVKTIGGNQAPAKFQRIAERGFRSRCFRPRIDHACGNGRVSRPRGNESPAHHHRFGLAIVPTNDRDILLRRDIESRCEVPPRSRRQEFPLCGGLIWQDITLAHEGRLRWKRQKMCDGAWVFAWCSGQTLLKCCSATTVSEAACTSVGPSLCVGLISS